MDNEDIAIQVILEVCMKDITSKDKLDRIRKILAVLK